MKIGTTINLEIHEPGSNKVIKYRSKIIEKNEKYLFIDHPIHIKTKKTTFFPIGTEFTAIYNNNHKNLYKFQTKVIKTMNMTIPTLVITLPDEESIEKIQRREFVRIKYAVDVAIHCPYHTFSPFTTVTVDISGGGLSMIMPKGVFLEKDKKILVWMVLPMLTGANKYVQAEAKVIRMNQVEDNAETMSITFTAISNEDEQNIVKFCFERQREERLSTWA